jgi:hypothetical protein
MPTGIKNKEIEVYFKRGKKKIGAPTTNFDTIQMPFL